MDSKEYWTKREQQKLDNQLKDVDKLEKELKTQFIKTSNDIEKEIHALYSKYSNDNNISYAEASKMLTSSEFKTWKYDLKTYVNKIKETGDERLLLELNTLSMRSRISRLEEMLYQVDKHINNLAINQENAVKLTLENTVKDTYYTDIYNMHQFVGVGTSFALVDDKLIKNILATPFFGSNYSERIWRNRTKLQWVIKDNITNMVTQGKPSREVAKEISNVMGNSYENAIRLVNSEHAHVMAQSTKASYKELGVDEYEYLSTLDKRTSVVCQGLDGKVFKVSDAMAGINYPPMHANCRSTTIPKISENYSTRFARNEEGKGIEVPSDMKYPQWNKIFIEAA